MYLFKEGENKPINVGSIINIQCNNVVATFNTDHYEITYDLNILYK